MLVDILSNNVDSIPPIINNKDLGLVWQFNKGIPFGFGEGIYRQVGFSDGKKIAFKTINEYCELVNKKMDEFYEFSNLIIPFFDAITNPADKPKMQKPVNDKENVKIMDDISDQDETCTTFSCSSQSTEIDPVNMVISPPNKSKFIPSDKPCFKMATDGSCDIQACKYSHDEILIKKCRSELASKLKKFDT